MMTRFLAGIVGLVCVAIISTGNAFAHGEKAVHPHIAAAIFTNIHNAILERNPDGSVANITFTATNQSLSERRIRVRAGVPTSITGGEVLTYTVTRMTIWDTCTDRGMPEYASIHQFIDTNQEITDMHASIYVDLTPCGSD